MANEKDQQPTRAESHGWAPSSYFGGCDRHRDRTDLSCCKIRRADGSPLTTADAWVEIQRLRAALTRCLPIIQADAQMVADISRFAPLDHASQTVHDTTEYESERLVREIPVLLGVPNAEGEARRL